MPQDLHQRGQDDTIPPTRVLREAGNHLRAPNRENARIRHIYFSNDNAHDQLPEQTTSNNHRNVVANQDRVLQASDHANPLQDDPQFNP